MTTVRTATANVTRVACIQAEFSTYSRYQRSDSDGGGKLRKRAPENDIGAMIRIGRIR